MPTIFRGLFSDLFLVSYKMDLEWPVFNFHITCSIAKHVNMYVCGFGSSPIVSLMFPLQFFIQWLVNYKKQKKFKKSTFNLYGGQFLFWQLYGQWYLFSITSLVFVYMILVHLKKTIQRELDGKKKVNKLKK
jgi:hypothetical protein